MRIFDVSASGLGIDGKIDACIGDRVAVRIEQFDTMMAQVIWMSDERLGLSLDDNSIRLTEQD